MNGITQKLFFIPNKVELVYNSRGTFEVLNLPYNRFDVNVYKGDNSTIDFVVRDTDRKPISLMDKTLTAWISNVQNAELVLKRDLIVIDDVAGQVRLCLFDGDLLNWAPGFYQYAITYLQDDGKQGFVYTNQAFRAIGTFELHDGVIPATAFTIEVKIFNSDIGDFFDNTDDSFVSSSISGAAQTNLTNTLHTVAVYLTSFCGVFTIEATLDEVVPTDPNSWYTVDTGTTLTFTSPTSGIVHVNFTANVNWVRFRYNPDLLNLGTVDKVLYRP